jgi:hypothetical protein
MEFPDPVERNPLRAAALSILPFFVLPVPLQSVRPVPLKVVVPRRGREAVGHSPEARRTQDIPRDNAQVFACLSRSRR